MTKLTEQSNIADIAAVYNELKGTNTDVKTLAKRGKAKREPKAPKEKKEKGPVIRVVAEQLLLEVVTHDEDKRPYGHSYDEILNRIHAQFEGAKTTVACLRWYAVHMRERGEKVPNRQRATPTATTKKEA